MGFLKEALGEGRRADGPFPGESFFAALLLAVAAGSCRAEAVEAPPIRQFGETVCEAMDLCGTCTGISCPDGHVRSVCTATELDFIGAAAVTVGCLIKQWKSFAETVKSRSFSGQHSSERRWITKYISSIKQ